MLGCNEAKLITFLTSLLKDYPGFQVDFALRTVSAITLACLHVLQRSEIAHMGTDRTKQKEERGREEEEKECVREREREREGPPHGG